MLSRNLRIRSLIAGATVASALVIAIVAHAQTPAATGSTSSASVPKGDLWLRTKLGSFKALQRGTDMIDGHFEASFTGSFLIVGFDEKSGKITATGNLRKEYEEGPHKRIVYYGTGKITIDGKLRSMQWFGRDLDGKFNGFAVFRMYGEFDRDLKTGDFSFDGYKTKFPWGTNGPIAIVPPSGTTSTAPELKKVGG